MLEFFRRYQKIIYIIVTIVIVLSFSFFGTYSAFTNTHTNDTTAFKAIDGTPISRSQLETMTAFIATDMEDLFAFGARGANFLNDGVLSVDFLKTGLALELIQYFPQELKKDFDKRLKSEKNFSLYEHPKAKFLSAKSAWGYVLPEMSNQYDQLVLSEDPLSAQAIDARIDLYQSQRVLTPFVLRQVLAYQLRQYPWLSADPQLEKGDLFLFGYHTVEDWFGPAFTRLAAEAIINGAIVARQKGYEVSNEEAWAALISNAQKTYMRLNEQKSQKRLESPETLLSEQLLAMRLDQTQASEVWKQVLLFRRLLRDTSGSALVDALALDQFVEYADMAAVGELYRLPSAFRLSTFRDLQKFTLYLNRISNLSMNSLDLPNRFLSIQEVKAQTPALVQKGYRVKVAALDQRRLRTLISLKETWDWETQEANWKELQKNMSEVGISKAATKEERYAYLQKLDSATRKRVDQFARDRILAAHPERIDEALTLAPVEEKVLSLRSKGGPAPLAGLSDATLLMKQLDEAQVAATEREITLKQFSADGQNFYRITLLEKTPEEILSFEQAKEDGTLDALLDAYLEDQYEKIRLAKPEVFRRADGEWKSFKDASQDIAQEVFKDILAKIDVQAKEKLTPQVAATRRLYSYVEKAQQEIQKNPEKISQWVISENASQENASNEKPTIEAQWKLEKTPYRALRSENGEASVQAEELLKLAPGSYSKVNTPSNGDLSFFQMQKIEKTTDTVKVAQKALEAQRLLGEEEQRHLFRQLFKEWLDKGALSIGFLKEVE